MVLQGVKEIWAREKARTYFMGKRILYDVMDMSGKVRYIRYICVYLER